MNTMTIRVPLHPEHGPLLPAEAMSLLMGVPVEEIRAHSGGEQGTGVMTLPQEWVKAGRRRAKEAHAHGHGGMVEAMTYWAARDHGACLEIEYTDLGGKAVGAQWPK
ncbi:hypothetical protein A5668_01385 [Mycolicibacterium fortuitum]|uniref:hypothetical protein n=1 Tax=Mycolicibacterium fortuitum TaxID=1766 RepID=UPI0007EA3DD2|nr:hypothetical protein [Mycolicibacterium fortuitum]OBB07093.1 hypothetical protein A5668_01385 [Mycolicibacterium fortuitum]SKV50215.1 Uncharacterised protein [Mycobacteroides abscessus subsp. abscessus]